MQVHIVQKVLENKLQLVKLIKLEVKLMDYVLKVIIVQQVCFLFVLTQFLGTETPVPCPLGTYNDLTGKAASGDCKACKAGRYWDVVGITGAMVEQKQCKQGFWCIGGSQTPTPTDGTLGKKWEPGYYCEEGTAAQTQWPAGSYEPREGSFSSSWQTCPAGYFCPLGATTPTICPIKNYWPSGSGSATFCPNGRYNDDQTGLEASDQCKECTTGFYWQNGEIVDR
jgi:hypothetical protein